MMSLNKHQKPARPLLQKFANRAKNLDFGPIAYKLMANGWTREQTIKAIGLYLMFLGLIYLYPNRQIIPTPEIDAVWHQHILDTSKYAEDCDRLFGRFVHHFPYFGQRGESDRDNLYLAFAETKTLFQEYFGVELLAQTQSNSDEEETTPQPADCEPLGDSKADRPRVELDFAEVWAALPGDRGELVG
ncbi:glycine-rich domain-containing protein [Phormidium sp. CCY1219]|uniref:glycine-rich domain-containing protein n=1 Tax=Phormidium sp. CCY1219 TaxID=2886104 RepID=UPI002D1E5D0B|nr:hypothetical protein [Phormidium sp. CCY1219]MEB3830005.1 hypothetical protein [Phormidium sp. CCY1219]